MCYTTKTMQNITQNAVHRNGKDFEAEMMHVGGVHKEGEGEGGGQDFMM